MIKVKKQALKPKPNVFTVEDNPVVRETTTAEIKESENSANEINSVEKRDFSGVFARLKRSVRKKSISIF
ncbi:MAG TPA: hypothetical protein VNI84_17730 [Pyrinomonadaceae bacterium]|nr:hypothetical protein [Pyrinomonadaceae bacterium]